MRESNPRVLNVNQTGYRYINLPTKNGGQSQDRTELSGSSDQRYHQTSSLSMKVAVSLGFEPRYRSGRITLG
jgi:hypothetical protein